MDFKYILNSCGHLISKCQHRELILLSNTNLKIMRYNKSTKEVFMVNDVIYNSETEELEHVTIASPMHINYSQKGNVAHCYIGWERVVR